MFGPTEKALPDLEKKLLRHFSFHYLATQRGSPARTQPRGGVRGSHDFFAKKGVRIRSFDVVTALGRPSGSPRFCIFPRGGNWTDQPALKKGGGGGNPPNPPKASGWAGLIIGPNTEAARCRAELFGVAPETNPARLPIPLTSQNGKPITRAEGSEKARWVYHSMPG